MTHYELVTQRGTRVMAFDRLDRAREAAKRESKRVGIRYTIIEVTRTERVLEDAA